VELAGRTRIFDAPGGYRLLGIISPIYNEPGCATGSCHVHPKDKKVLGALDVVVSLAATDKEIASYTRGIIGLAVVIFLGASAIIGIFLLRFVNRPIKELITGAHHIGNGDYDYKVDVIDREDEMGQLAIAINEMRKEIREQQEELSKQREEYQNIFELAPCYITVQGRDLKLIRYNREFAEQFDPKPGDYCYKAYKGRSEPCIVCPVMKTFEDGKSHYSEESGVNKDGTKSFWVVRTSPIRDSKGEVTAAMELCLDVTQMKHLEKEVQKSEEKYRSIFNSIPNPVFVLDASSLKILDCNDSVTPVYGVSKDELLMTSFLNLFEENSRERYASELKGNNVLNQVRQTNRAGQTLFVNIRISPSEYLGRDVLLVTTSDITKRLMTEQQLIQASKMTTLGEMATGVAHELNQPLSVIKTASSFLSKKVKKNEEIKGEILGTLTEEIESHVDRASRIISHMREFGRKSEVSKERVQVNETLDRAHEIFSQQLKLREIEVVKDYEEDLPFIHADSNRLEQVFINLLINARDAIEEKMNDMGHENGDKKIFLKTSSMGKMIKIEVRDTGKGIPRPILDKIFEPFFTTKNVGKGTGLGLSISYGIVQDYDGTIKVETEENKGSNFVIMFPVPDEA
jgi:histidine kinase